MKNRTAIAILLVAAGLLAFIVLFERDRMTTAELEGRKGRVFVDYRRDAVTGLTLRGADGERVVLERRGGPGDPAGERWIIAGGERELLADAGAVRQVLAAIDFLLEDRVVREPGAAEDLSFGLAEPRVEASFTARGRTTSFRVGADAPGDKVYLAVDGRPGVIAVEGEFLGEVDKGRDDLRDRRLLERQLSAAVAVSVTGGEEPVRLTREDDGAPWRVELDGTWVLAAAERAGGLLRELSRLEAVRFVADGVGPESLGGYGLDPAALVAEVALVADERVEIRLGGACEDREGAILATVTGSGTVACVDGGILDEFRGGAGRFRELRLAPVREDDVTRVSLFRGGDSLVLERDGESGSWAVAGGGDGPGIDGEAVSGLLGLLSASRAFEMIAGERALAGAGEPAARVALALAGGQPAVELGFHSRPESDRVAVRREGEDALLVADAALLESIRPDLLAFRTRVVESGDALDLVTLEVAGPADFSLAQKHGSWSLAAPVELAVDGTAARGMARRAARIEVERFAAAAARPEHGLSRPFATVTATFVDERTADEDGTRDRTAERRAVIEIGAETAAADGSRFARVAGGDGAVFVLERSWIEDFSRPPVARDLLQVDADPIRRVVAIHAGGTVEIAREGTGWSSPAEGFDAIAFGRAFTDMAAVRALRAAALGAQAAAAAVGEPRLVLELHRDGEAGPIRLALGGRSGDPAESGVVVRREDVPAAFVVPARVVDDLLAALGLAAPPASSAD